MWSTYSWPAVAASQPSSPDRSASTASRTDDVVRVAAAYVAFARRQPGHFQVMFRPELSQPEKHPAVQEAGDAALKVLTDLVDRLGVADPQAVGITLWALGHGLALLALDGLLALKAEAWDTDQRCDAVNDLLAAGAGRPYLTTHDGLRPHLHFAPDSDDVVGRVKAVTAGSLSFFTVEAEGARLGVCARTGCDTVFVDTSRNGRRAYCTARCGNYDAVTRHRTARRS
jgi:hypothetical protein